MRLPSATRWSALIVWAGVAACAAFWASRVLVKAPAMPPGATTVPTVQALRGDISRLLGQAEIENAEAPVAAVPSRFKLLGVVAPRAPQAAAEGVALIAVDDKPARAYRVGATVDGALVLQRVHVRGADLGARDAAQASVSLTVQPLPPPATGVPASRAAGAAPTFAPPRPPMPRPLATAPRVEPADPTGEPDAGADDGEIAPGPAPRPGQVVQ
jgi:general secretion pathway protein C